MQAQAFEKQQLIRFHHCDPAGIVFYPQYLILFDELMEDWFNEGLGLDFARFHMQERVGTPAVHLECDFLDYVSFNVYLHHENDFRNYVCRLQNLAGFRPLVISEFASSKRSVSVSTLTFSNSLEMPVKAWVRLLVLSIPTTK